MLKILQWIIGGFACILLINLVWTVSSLDHSIMYLVSSSLDNNASETIKDFKDSWAIRGQMGDILSGHFSALAFLAVAFSIILQNEANRKMQMSIEKQDKALEQQEKSLQQQSKALEVQSESLKAQIEELQQSRKESKRQTEEFFIANMNVKLDRYYKMLDSQIEQVVSKNLVDSYISNKKIMKNNQSYDPSVKKAFLESINAIETIILILNNIYKEILDLGKDYPNAYQSFIDELTVKALSTQVLHQINVNYNESTKNQCRVFEFFKE